MIIRYVDCSISDALIMHPIVKACEIELFTFHLIHQVFQKQDGFILLAYNLYSDCFIHVLTKKYTQTWNKTQPLYSVDMFVSTS